MVRNIYFLPHLLFLLQRKKPKNLANTKKVLNVSEGGGKGQGTVITLPLVLPSSQCSQKLPIAWLGTQEMPETGLALMKTGCAEVTVLSLQPFPSNWSCDGDLRARDFA